MTIEQFNRQHSIAASSTILNTRVGFALDCSSSSFFSYLLKLYAIHFQNGALWIGIKHFQPHSHFSGGNWIVAEFHSLQLVVGEAPWWSANWPGVAALVLEAAKITWKGHRERLWATGSASILEVSNWDLQNRVEDGLWLRLQGQLADMSNVHQDDSTSRTSALAHWYVCRKSIRLLLILLSCPFLENDMW